MAKIILRKNGYHIEYISPYSLCRIKEINRNFPPFKILIDLIKLDLKRVVFRLKEFSLNILDLIHGDQMRIVLKRKKFKKMNSQFKKLNNRIIKCRSCPSLIKFRKKLSKIKENNILKKNIGQNQLQVLVIQMEIYYL